MEDFKRVLVLAPHTDDAELGCGATINKLLEEKKEVFLAVFSLSSVEKTFSPNSSIVLEELKESAKIIGVKPENLIIYNNYQTRYFPEKRQDILEDMIKLRQKINPDIVFMPTLNDIHQDHQTISREGLRAFKHITILGYEDPWNHLTFNTVCFVPLDKKNIEVKLAAIEKYKSQSHRQYTNKNFLESLACVRGVQIGVSWAEAFEVVRLVLK